ncbi:MAG: hypothetical protein LWW85_13280 [Marinilabiliales bacterium]|nr:hypothetical protein [Marinilabiliales bacterium]
MRDPIKTYDARWEVTEFNANEITRLFEATFGYARLIGVDTIVFSRDARLGCAQVLDSGINLAVLLGFRVLACLDPISTPLSYFVAMQTSLEHPHTMGLSITASHNPRQYIGIKYTIPGVEAIGYDCGPHGGLKKVKELFHDSNFGPSPRVGGSLHIIPHPASDYIAYSMKLAGVKDGSLSGLKVVLDTFNGSAGQELYRALTQCGVAVIPHRLVPDGNFPTGSPNPTSQHKMDPALEMARQQGADLILGIDGDGDRIVFADQKGIFSAGFVMVPILQAIFSEKSEGKRYPVLYDPKVNPLALAKWAELQAEPILFRNGHSQIKSHMKTIGALAGAEESGHFYHQLPLDHLTVAGENSLYTLLLFLRSVHQDPAILGLVRSMQDQVYTSGEFNFHFETDTVRDEAMEAAIDLFRHQYPSVMTTASEDGADLEGTVVYYGVRVSGGSVSLEDRWFAAYIRTATNEKGIVRTYISSSDNTFGEMIKSAVVKILKEDFKGNEIE